MNTPYSPPKSNVDLPSTDQEKDLSSPFSAKGRFGRLSYIAWNALLFIVVVLMFSVLGATTNINMEYSFLNDHRESQVGMVVFFIIIIPSIIIGFIFLVRRLHDIGISGWWSVLSFIPVVSAIFTLYVIARQGDIGSNAFAPPRTTALWENVIGGVIAVVLGVLTIIVIISALM